MIFLNLFPMFQGNPLLYSNVSGQAPLHPSWKRGLPQILYQFRQYQLLCTDLLFTLLINGKILKSSTVTNPSSLLEQWECKGWSMCTSSLYAFKNWWSKCQAKLFNLIMGTRLRSREDNFLHCRKIGLC